ncbi:MAG: hypothetical protein NC110_03635 [Ruminococcus sp.]|nr:hypothetical protein [Ruminococcus sp.]
MSEIFASLDFSSEDVAFMSRFFSSALLNCYFDDFNKGEVFNMDLFTIMFDTVRNLKEKGGLLESKSC